MSDNQSDGLRRDIEELRRLLTRIRTWDMMDVADDGKYWRSEIDHVLQAHDGIKSTRERTIND